MNHKPSPTDLRFKHVSPFHGRVRFLVSVGLTVLPVIDVGDFQRSAIHLRLVAAFSNFQLVSTHVFRFSLAIAEVGINVFG